MIKRTQHVCNCKSFFGGNGDDQQDTANLVGEVDQIDAVEDKCRREKFWHLMFCLSTIVGFYIF